MAATIGGQTGQTHRHKHVHNTPPPTTQAPQQQQAPPQTNTGNVGDPQDSISPELQALLQEDPTLAQDVQQNPELLAVLEQLTPDQLQQVAQDPSQLDQLLSSMQGGSAGIDVTV